ncbi:MAG: phosphoribosylformylglycinamidine synthase subunit PurQ, partial [Chlamydiia bacterium]|nr:phosphoribosylformylglycinamidine synthase subunit PurQ [Chlamydiia bacterium]
MTIRTLIVTGFGINCEREMSLASRMAGAHSTFIHAKALLGNPAVVMEYDHIYFPGGFSFADELGAGQALANKMRFSVAHGQESLKERLLNFVQSGGCILGVCNGFQLLIKLGLLGEGKVSLTFNDSDKFENRWAWHTVCASPCIWTEGVGTIALPLRHGEGKIVCSSEAVRSALFAEGRVALQYCTPDGDPTQDYPHNPNGSEDAIAGLCDATGRILGL